MVNWPAFFTLLQLIGTTLTFTLFSHDTVQLAWAAGFTIHVFCFVLICFSLYLQILLPYGTTDCNLTSVIRRQFQTTPHFNLNRSSFRPFLFLYPCLSIHLSPDSPSFSPSPSLLFCPGLLRFFLDHSHYRPSPCVDKEPYVKACRQFTKAQ